MIVIRNKKKKLVWMLVWAGLFIAVLYSPIGSPDLYTSKYYYAEYQSMTIKDGTIPNASKIKSSQEYYDNAPELPDISESLHANYAAGNYSSTPVSTSQGSYYGGGQTLSYQNNNSSGGGGGGGGSFVVSGRSGGSAASSGFSMTSGITTLSLTSNLNASVPKQMSTAYTADTGGTDPGGDPTGDPIPVGDGWGILVLLGLCYATFKKRLFIKNQLNPLTGKKD